MDFKLLENFNVIIIIIVMQETFYNTNSTVDSSYNMADQMRNNSDLSQFFHNFYKAYKANLNEFKGPKSNFLSQHDAAYAAWRASLVAHDHSPEQSRQISSLKISSVQPFQGKESEMLSKLPNFLPHITSQPQSKNLLKRPKIGKNPFRLRTEAIAVSQQRPQLKQPIIGMPGRGKFILGHQAMGVKKRLYGANEKVTQRGVSKLIMSQDQRNSLMNQEIVMSLERPQQRRMEMKKDQVSEIIRLRRMRSSKGVEEEKLKRQ